MKKYVIFLMTLGFFSGCKEKGNTCDGLYDKWTRCLHDSGASIEELKERFESKEAFVSKCKQEKDRNLMACMNKSSCGDFLFCADASKTKNRKLCGNFHEELVKCAEDLPREHEIHGFLEERERFVDDCQEKKYFSCKKKSSCGDKIFCLKTFGLQSKTEGCAKLFDKMTTCTKELGEGGKMMASKLGNKDKFVSDCTKQFDRVKKMVDCAVKSPCEAFWTCALGEEAAKAMTNMAMEADMPADAPAADMPAEAPATDMPQEIDAE